MPALKEFAEVTTFHGPNHAVASSSKSGRAFWLIIFGIGLILAFWQSADMLYSYFHDSSKTVRFERESTPEQLTDTYYFKVCPAYWVDEAKVIKAVRRGKFSYQNLLFALSLIPTISDFILEDIGTWDHLPKVDRIWGVPTCSGILRRKRDVGNLMNFVSKPANLAFGSAGAAAASAGAAAGSAGKIAGSAVKMPINAGKAAVKGKLDRYVGKVAKAAAAKTINTGINSARQVGKTAKGLPDAAEDLVDAFGEAAGTYTKVVGPAAKLLEGSLGPLSGPVGQITGALGVMAAAGNLVGQVGVLTQRTLDLLGVLGQDWKAIMNVINRILGAECDDSCAPIKVMKNWSAQADSFYEATKGKHETLTDFFASIANEFNPLEGLGGKHVKWEMFNGQICQVTELSAGNITSADGLLAKVELVETIGYLVKEIINLKKPQVAIVPYTTESSYGKSPDILEGGGTAGGALKLQNLLNPIEVLYNVAGGVLTRVSFGMPKIEKHTREESCIAPSDKFLRVPDGHRTKRCKTVCRKHHEEMKNKQLQKDYRVFTQNDFGDIPLNRKLAPSRFLDIEVDDAGAAQCMSEEDCALQHYCEEWLIDTTTVNTQERVQMTDMVGCRESLSNLLGSVKFELKLGKAYEVTYGRRLSVVDMLGITGGLLGLYVGCSITTLAHCVAYWMARSMRVCKPRSAVAPATDMGTYDDYQKTHPAVVA